MSSHFFRWFRERKCLKTKVEKISVSSHSLRCYRETKSLREKGRKTACQVILVNVIWKVNIVKEIAAMASEKFDKEHQLTLLEWGEKNLAEGWGKPGQVTRKTDIHSWSIFVMLYQFCLQKWSIDTLTKILFARDHWSKHLDTLLRFVFPSMISLPSAIDENILTR